MATLTVRFFAVLKERIGHECETLEISGTITVPRLVEMLKERFPDQAPVIDRCRVAVNQELSMGDVAPGDEVALIPPISGGSGPEPDTGDHAMLTHDPIDVGAALARISHAGAGGQSLFLGVVRDHNEGRGVRRIHYEAYEEMALAKLWEITREVRARFPVARVVLVHRLGMLEVGEVSVLVAVSAGHRDGSFAACRFGIDRIKEIVPIWKKEYFEDGSAWVGLQSAPRSSGTLPSRPAPARGWRVPPRARVAGAREARRRPAGAGGRRVPPPARRPGPAPCRSG